MSGDFICRCGCGAWNGQCNRPLAEEGFKPPGLLAGTVSHADALRTCAELMTSEERQALAEQLLRMNRATIPRPGMRERLGAWIRDRRKASKVSQNSLAMRVGLGRPALSNYEAGKQSCTLEMFISLCDALGDDPLGAFEEVLGDAQNVSER